MKKIYSRPKSLQDVHTHYCSGCGHGTIHNLICRVIDELGIRERTIAVAPVGCAVIAYEYWDFDVSEAAHGRTPCVASGIKRVHPEALVFSYQGDGDLCAIGLSEIIHTANRQENITVIFVNNAVYGMTGGQMAPTSIPGQKTDTTPLGRNVAQDGYPLDISKILALIPGAKYIERVAVHRPQYIIKAKNAINKAFRLQIDKAGFSFVEVLSMCPTYWGLSPKESADWIDKVMMKEYPLGVIKDDQSIR